MRIDRFNYPFLFEYYKACRNYCKLPKSAKYVATQGFMDRFRSNDYKEFSKDYCDCFASVSEMRNYYYNKRFECIDNLLTHFNVDYISDTFAKNAAINSKSIIEGVSGNSLFSLLGNISGYMLLGDTVVSYSIVEDLAYFETGDRKEKQETVIYLPLWWEESASYERTIEYEIGLGDKGNEQKMAIYTCIAVLLMKKYGEVETVACSGNSKTKISETEDFYNGAPFSVTRIDSTWLKTIVRTEGFQVRGFWRLQACGRNWGERKLIYVDSFQKHGYVRRAKKLVQEEKEMKQLLPSVA